MVICPVCGVSVDVPQDAKNGDVIVCPVCYARLKISGNGGGWSCEVV